MPERSEGIAVRVPPELKAAAQKAAKDDHRTVSSLVEKVLTEWLEAKGYLAHGQDDLFGRSGAAVRRA